MPNLVLARRQFSSHVGDERKAQSPFGAQVGPGHQCNPEEVPHPSISGWAPLRRRIDTPSCHDSSAVAGSIKCYPPHNSNQPSAVSAGASAASSAGASGAASAGASGAAASSAAALFRWLYSASRRALRRCDPAVPRGYCQRSRRCRLGNTRMVRPRSHARPIKWRCDDSNPTRLLPNHAVS